MQQAADNAGAGLVYYLFDLLELDGEQVAALPLAERKNRLAALLGSPPPGIDFSPHEAGDGEAFRRAACGYGLEGVVSKRLDRRYLPDPPRLSGAKDNQHSERREAPPSIRAPIPIAAC
jgi:bifunctional non-homologous end joining protein LigD